MLRLLFENQEGSDIKTGAAVEIYTYTGGFISLSSLIIIDSVSPPWHYDIVSLRLN